MVDQTVWVWGMPYSSSLARISGSSQMVRRALIQVAPRPKEVAARRMFSTAQEASWMLLGLR